MTACAKTIVALTPKPLRSRSVRSGPPTSSRAKRCWMPALARTAICAPVSACATDARPPKALPFRLCAQGRLVGTVRLWHVSAGGVPALMLGPLAVDDACRKLGVGAALMDHALAAARARGHRAVLLLGDAPYYARFGFSADKTGELSLPGPFERDRLLGLELRDGALDGAWGMIVADRRAAAQTEGSRARKVLRSYSTSA